MAIAISRIDHLLMTMTIQEKNTIQEYDVAIIGGGLAGLSAAIQIKKAGHTVVLLEKEKYPFHKVCGEYMSMESRDFLNNLGLPLDEMDLPRIDTLFLTSPNGRSFTTRLPLGGFGISRYTLDHSIANIALESGVVILQETKAEDITLDEVFHISYSRSNEKNQLKAKVCCAAYGKRSNLDVKWKRDFLKQQDKQLENYIAVKYHIRINREKNEIALHNFEKGYCGISAIEEGKYCLCYMTKAESLKSNDHNILQLEKNILYRNPYLKEIFTKSEILDEFPITISQINFTKKTLIENNILMLGDAGGMITPLCGNGMSIALHTAKISAHFIDLFLKEIISREELELFYVREWKRNFSKRMQTGRTLQHFFGNNNLSNLFVRTFTIFPFLAKPLVKMTHGVEF